MHKHKKRNTRRRLSRILRSKFKQLINKEFVLEIIDELENCTFKDVEFENFKKIVQDFDDEQWEIIVNQHNVNVNVKRKTDEGDKEKKAFNVLVSAIDQDEFLKYHNVDFGRTNFARWDDDCFEAKVYLTCGVYFVGGTVKEIVNQIKHELKDNNIKIRVFCLSCSSKKLSFMNQYCLCSDCGSISDLDENKVVEKYDIKDKEFWRVKFLTFTDKIGFKKNA